MERTIVFLLLAAVMDLLPAKAQSEGGLLLDAGVEKSFNKKLSLNVEAGFRTRNNFKTVDRVILEAECLSNRRKHGYFEGNPKHVRALLGAIYVEKALTDRFSLSAGYHSYGATKDFMLSGNLVGRIN
jgi:hypothetical protein